jgi:ketosteroid isomerase-like protein
MKNVLVVALVVLAAAGSAFSQKKAAAEVKVNAADAAAVRAAFDRLVDGIKQVDAEMVMAAYEKSDRLLVFNNNGTATLGWETVKTNTESAYSKLANVTLEITGLRIEMLGPKAAYVSCKWKQTQENAGKLEDASGRMTLVYKLIGKDWKITHRHTSPDNPAASRPVFPSERQ